MKIICIANNYSALPGGEPTFFMKPETALLRNNAPLYYPDFTKELQYETAVVLRISKLGRGIAPKFAARYYHEIGIGIDFTAHDLQRECIAKGLPWECSKVFDYSAPVSAEFMEVSKMNDPQRLRFSLACNGILVQQGNTEDMIWGFNQVVSYVSQWVTLKMGDLIFTGTPAGSGIASIGDTLVACIEDQEMLRTEIK